MPKLRKGTPTKRNLVWVRVTDDVLADLQKAAAQEGQTVSEFLRLVGHRAALIRLGKY